MKYLADVLMWSWCALAWWLVMILPPHRGGPIKATVFWLLPWAGFYAYHGPRAAWRWSRLPRR